jgi:hypothetical protein
MPSKLPGPVAGTAAQAEPKTAPDAIIESDGDAAGIDDSAAGEDAAAAGADEAVVEVDEPQAARARGTATTTAAMPARRRRRVLDIGNSW